MFIGYMQHVSATEKEGAENVKTEKNSKPK